MIFDFFRVSPSVSSVPSVVNSISWSSESVVHSMKRIVPGDRERRIFQTRRFSHTERACIRLGQVDALSDEGWGGRTAQPR